MDSGVRRERRLTAAEGYLQLDMPEHALRELDGDASPHTLPAEWYRLRGEAQRLRGDFASALDEFQRAVSVEAPTLGALFGMAWCYKRTDHLDRAVEVMEEAYRLAPDEPTVLYNLACYFSLTGDRDRALSWLGRAIRMQSELRRLVPDETDFDGLRDDPYFRLVTEMPEGLDED